MNISIAALTAAVVVLFVVLAILKSRSIPGPGLRLTEEDNEPSIGVAKLPMRRLRQLIGSVGSNHQKAIVPNFREGYLVFKPTRLVVFGVEKDSLNGQLKCLAEIPYHMTSDWFVEELNNGSEVAMLMGGEVFPLVNFRIKDVYCTVRVLGANTLAFATSPLDTREVKALIEMIHKANHPE